ncbi:MAG TPA: DUF1583 domain-containing protein, partial [Planctomycetaceae bacterium]|nr:DUF1583 domain-containing protein [Planctomycetaceae bacterium]
CLHAVAAAVRRDETQAAGLALLEAMLDRWDAIVPQQPVGSGINSTWLRFHAARRQLQAGRIDDGVRLALAGAVKPFNDQPYGAEYSDHLRRRQVAEAASIVLAAGRVGEALDLLGPLVDLPESRYSMYYPGPNLAAMLGRELHKRPAAERYELLRHWTLPDGERTALRDLTDFVPGDAPDTPNAVALPAAGLLHDVYSTSWDLIHTARELGRLDELLRELDAISPPTSQTQAILTLGGGLRDGSAGPTARSGATTGQLTALLTATTQNIPKWEDQQKTPFPWLTFVVAAEAARHPVWHDVSQQLLERLIEHTQRLQWDRPRAHVRMAWAEVVRRRNGGDAKLSEIAPASATVAVPEAWDKLRPKSWIASGIETVAQHANGSLPDVWFAQDGYVEHLTGPYDSHLFFQYPLTGDFEIALDGREGGWAEGYTGYGGALFAVNGYVDQAPLRAPGGTGFVPGPQLTNLLHKNPWNQHRIKVAGGAVRYLANGQFIHEDRPGASSPWFSLGADWGRTPIFRNLRVTGTPIIPREVPLLADVRLRGWVSEYYGETRRDPLRELPTQTDVRADPASGGPPVVDEPATDWFWRDGELRSPQRDAFWPGVIESRLFYHRPLCPAETVQYEFFYREREFEAHPTIGRRAFVLQPNGVTTHWLTDGELDIRGLLPDNGAFGERKLPLKPDDWNAVEVAMHADAVHIRLNGELIVEQPLVDRDSRTFGFYHDASNTAVRLRDAVLRGDWPREFSEELRAAIEHPQPANPSTDGRFVTAIMTEPYFADNAYAVYRRALALEPAARYDYLSQWVLPGATHDTLRMAGSFTPTHPAPPVLAENPIDVATAEARQAIDGRRVQTGGNFVCPAILLVLSAAELNRLDELGEAVFKLDAASSPAQARARAAMLGIIALLQDRPAEALDAVWECTRLVLEPGSTEQHLRWSEPALCSLAILHPATREAAYELLDRIQRKQLQSGQPGSAEFSRYVRQLHGQVHYLMHGGDPAAFGAQPQLAQWRTVPQPCARTRGGGYPIGAYDAITGELALRGGHDLEMAYFQSPLRGNYEVRARLSQFDYREFMPYVAGVSNVLKFTHKNVKVQSLRGAAKEVPTPQEIVPRVKSWADYRLVVQDGHYTCYVGDQVLYEADVSPSADPWVAFVGWAGQSSRAARNVVITGTPEIPDELELLSASDLRGWLADYYGTATGQSPYPWRLEGGELKSDQTVIRGATPGRLKIENV